MKIEKFSALYPYKQNKISLDGISMNYVDEGEKDRPVIVMVHGNPTWSFYYRNLINAFKTDYRIIVPDHIGCGFSDKPQNYPYTLEQHIQNLENLIEQLELKNVNLVMHDWGGGIASGYATRHPENVQSFVAMNTAAFNIKALPWSIQICRIPILGDILVRGFNGFSLIALFAGAERKLSKQVKQGLIAPYNNWKNRIAILRFVQDIPWEKNHPTGKTIDEIEAKLPLLKEKPILFFWGDKDFVFTTKDFLSIWQEKFPQALAHIFKDAGHYIVEDAHERIVPLLKNFYKEKGI